ncbi:bifunctional protein-serine/threonine kinase/phosphatase [Aquabacterium sp. A7-Y]|uniref:bifunctional protein-serine/threonine kinase/phosphatase n=1 Tax=Aquabacterium sp. A7-Y TaxID=1349605 RepID=UPI00223DFFAC|nr:bifunctional protein-serine/threonine kinase/phosphatase [Aquabacterium sp. A7-Y]MCW7537567.1 bifunctional protein-serine/threonine kinase/phosphatase [Aquabacterium sp. A7-Y]
MGLEVEVGHCSARGPRPRNEDYAAVVQPARHEEAHGWIAAVADGVSAGGEGAEAAQTAVLCVVRDYHATPDTWDTSVALDRLIGAHNAWLADHNRRRGSAVAMCTLTALVLRGHGYTVAHVGDTRAWLLRGGDCVQLTQDHGFDHPDQRHRLTRALGLDDAVRVDYLQGELQPGDVFVLSTDGVHRTLPRRRLRELARQGDAREAAQALVQAALAAGAEDNATALVMRVTGLGETRLEDQLLRGRQLRVPPRLKVGDRLDGHVITALVGDDGVHRLYQARNAEGELVALKTLHESRAGDAEEREMLAHEAWLGSRVAGRDARGLVRVREQPEPSAFYILFDWHAGQTLEQLLAAGRRFDVGEVLAGALSIVRALGRLHRLGVIHRDIKPSNLHLGEDGEWRVLDLGVAVSGREPRAQRLLHAGTPSYMNPEQWPGHGTDGSDAEPADAQSDLYALGATLYRWLTGRLPYGEIEPYQIGRFRQDPRAPSRIRPDVPIWLDHIVLKAVARDKSQRFETAEEFALALERGASRPLPAPGATPLMARDPAALWKIALGLSLLFNVLLVVWLLFLPR